MRSPEKISKGYRLIEIYERLKKGEILNKENLSKEFNVEKKTIQRDISELRNYLSDKYVGVSNELIKYDKLNNGYYLTYNEEEWITNKEAMAICKILLGSRAFCKDEMNQLINKILHQITPSDRRKVIHMINNEKHNFVPLKHGKKLFDIIWELTNYILNCEIIKFTYKRQDGVINDRTVKPVAIMFSEYYFYLIAYFVHEDKDFPAIFRIDRINNLFGTKEKFKIPYIDRFNESEFRNRVQFMYSGELKKVKFNYTGNSIEAILDRIPTAKVISEKDGTYTICAESYGNGIDMWLRAQGDNVEIIEKN